MLNTHDRPKADIRDKRWTTNPAADETAKTAAEEDGTVLRPTRERPIGNIVALAAVVGLTALFLVLLLSTRSNVTTSDSRDSASTQEAPGAIDDAEARRMRSLAPSGDESVDDSSFEAAESARQRALGAGGDDQSFDLVEPPNHLNTAPIWPIDAESWNEVELDGSPDITLDQSFDRVERQNHLRHAPRWPIDAESWNEVELDGVGDNRR